MNARLAFVIAGVAIVALASCGHRGSVLPPLVPVQQRLLQSGAQSDQYSTAVLNDGPAAYYRLDDSATATAADSSGHNLNGTIGSSVTTSAPGLLAVGDTAMAFPGASNAASTVNVPANALLQPASAATLEAWIKFTANPKTYAVVVAYGSDSFYAPYDLFFRGGNKLVAQFYLSSGVMEVAAPNALNANTAYHIVSTFDGTTGRLYVNGTQVASVAKTGTIANYLPNYGLTIGDDAAFSDPAFAGTVDEVAVYGKVLSASQIAAHYQAGTIVQNGTPTPAPSATPTATPSPTPAPTATPTPTPPPSGAYAQTILADAPGAYYHLDDAGPSVADASGHSLSGTAGTGVGKGAPGLLPSYADSAMTFPGTQSATGTVNVPANASLQPATALSLEAWMRFPSTPATYAVVVAYGSDSFYAPYDLFFRAGGQLVAQFYLSSGVLEIADPSPLQSSTAYHAVSTFDGSVGRLYVNGVQVASSAKSGSIANYLPNFGLTIGDDAAFADPAFNGTIDEVAVYPGKTLTAAQVQAHYAAGTANATPPPTPAPTPTPQPGYDWTTMGFDLQRTGYNPNETALGSGSFGTLHSIWTASNGGEIGAPALAAAVALPGGGSADILYAGLGSGMFYAYNAATGAVVWSKQLGTSSYTCGGSRYSFGVNGAPTIDRAASRVYVGDGAMKVHALDLATGAEQAGWPVAIGTVTGADFIYGGLTYNPANHLLYAESSSTCDISPWYGRIAAINTQTATVANTFYPTQGTSGGGIWGFGGASIDPATNNVYIAVGNADTSGGAAQNAFYAEHVVALSADLTSVLASNFPNNPPGSDNDFGATPLLFQPPGCPGLLAAVNKSGAFDLYSRASIGNGPAQQIQMSITTDNGDFIGVPAYDPITNYVYVGMPATFGIYSPGVAAFSISSSCTLNPAPVWAAKFGADGAVQTTADTPRSPITIANGVLYVSDYGTSKTYAFDAAGGAQLWTASLGGPGIVGPIVANGKLYVGSLGTTMSAWAP